jgi:flagellar basal-body rod protein FlgB
MKLDDSMRHRLMDKTMGLLSHVLDYRAKNHGVISGNLSNIDTPGFEPKELEFDEVLKRAVEQPKLPLKRTNNMHLSSGMTDGKPSFSLHTLEAKGKRDPNDLDIDREMAKMSQNNLLYEATVKILSKKFEALRAAIEERRR